MRFKKLIVSDWQQFQDIDIDFHSRLTILTGANGSGKTTLLNNILAQHCDWPSKSLSTPKNDETSGSVVFINGFNDKNTRDEKIIGYIIYDNEQTVKLKVPPSNSLYYQISIEGRQSITCFFIPSHRSIFRYKSIDNIPLNRKDKDIAYSEVANASRNMYSEHHNSNTAPASFYMKNTLIGWGIQGYGSYNGDKAIMAKDDKQAHFFEGFKEVLRKIFPKTLGFEDFEIRNRKEIVFICNKGNDEFVFEQASGGLSTLIDIAWQIYMFSTEEKSNFTVIIDEIENHLHPVMQRQILPDLLNAFPNACFIVSTHSPLVVGSVQDSSVYVLKYNENKKILSTQIDLVNQAKTASEILDEVLGVSFTMPIWAEKKLEEIVSSYSMREMTNEDFTNMRKELKTVGLEKLMPEAISNILEITND